MLRRRGLPAIVRVGARHTSAGDLKLHAWLTTIGEVRITGVREAVGFKVLATFASESETERCTTAPAKSVETEIADSIPETTNFEGRAA